MEEEKENDDVGWLLLAPLERLTKEKNKLHDKNYPTSEMTNADRSTILNKPINSLSPLLMVLFV